MTDRTEGFLSMATAAIRAARSQLSMDDYPGFIVSRSYYSMFYCVSALLEESGLRFSSHGQAIGAFGREFIRTEKFPVKLHAYLKEAFDLRSSGDYDPGAEVTVEDAVESIQHAEEFLAETQHYFSKPK
jgi:uncharacterized protein (UPF0332 family)